MLLESQYSSTRVSGVWRTHGHGWENMPIRGGVDLTIMIHGTSKDTVQQASLNTMQIWGNMQVS